MSRAAVAFQRHQGEGGAEEQAHCHANADGFHGGVVGGEVKQNFADGAVPVDFAVRVLYVAVMKNTVQPRFSDAAVSLSNGQTFLCSEAAMVVFFGTAA